MIDDKYIRYVMLLSHIPGKTFTEEVVRAHVEHLKKMENDGQLVLCGPFSDYKGGIVVMNTATIEEARELAEADPFIKEGYETYEIRTLELSCEENNHMGMG